MSSEGSRFCLLCVSLLGLLTGCTSVPSVAENPRNNQIVRAQEGEDEHEGWLYKTLMGRRPAATTPAAATTPPATATPPANTAAAAGVAGAGPLIPGPASRSAAPSAPSGTEFLVEPSLTDAGPPPSLPPERPASIIRSTPPKAEEEKKGFELADLAPEKVWKSVKKASGYGPNETIARAAMKDGQDLFRDKKYKEAAAKFATAVDRAPDTPLEEDALFLQGESEFFADQYSKAHDTYGGLLKKYANTRHLDTVVAREFALGRYWEQTYTAKPASPITPNLTDGTQPWFDTFGYAVQAYQRVRMYDPHGPWADASLMALGSAYFRRGQYEDSAFNYDLLRTEYPNSKYQPMAHVLGLQAKMRVYQGTLYEGKSLNDAGQIADQALNQFGNQLGPERQHIAEARAQILEEKANRDFTRGEYYEQHKYFGAARFYYKSVIDEFPSTQKAQEARARMEKIRTEPDNPPQRFAWLTGMFETKKK